MSNIGIKIENFRAVKSADLMIDGITLVAGENGCGKSSISKLIYYLYKTVANYDLIVKENLVSELVNLFRFSDLFLHELKQEERGIRDEFRYKLHELRNRLNHSDFLEIEQQDWIVLLDKIKDIYELILPKLSNQKNSRLKYILKDILADSFNDHEEIVESFSKLKDFINLKFQDSIETINQRPTSLFLEELEGVFIDSELPTLFEVSELEDIIVALNKENLSIPYSIQNAIYIDTPMMISIQDSHNKHWDDLNELLTMKGDFSNKVTQTISQEIINGDVIVEEDTTDNPFSFSTEKLIFKRQDGSVFNLLDVATGIKAFSIIQLLLKKGKLNNKTLLIIDEPESNLHPQWIIEYARVIVLLNKEIGVKFFLASHNPDMVSAIRYISEKEGILEKVNFYLAKKDKESFQYNYLFLNKEIDPIFESFNIAIDRINQYGI